MFQVEALSFALLLAEFKVWVLLLGVKYRPWSRAVIHGRGKQRVDRIPGVLLDRPLCASARGGNEELKSTFVQGLWVLCQVGVHDMLW